jgi:hypothetical protein
VRTDVDDKVHQGPATYRIRENLGVRAHDTQKRGLQDTVLDERVLARNQILNRHQQSVRDLARRLRRLLAARHECAHFGADAVRACKKVS